MLDHIYSSILRAYRVADLAQSKCFTVNGTDDAKNFSETIQALTALGASKDQIGSLLSVISAILWLGNVTFDEDQQEQSYVADQNTIYLVSELLQVGIIGLTNFVV
ncbi:hypothetical protein BVRB_028870 [Beta vulgaris subsp. vulgaris]|uniref:Myosin motor domain-containing protein n=1 Tax=Beta vulgaris subsp. vulgaris TaxID=3555 RepID=A0A0J8B1E0_BETVV|nr:hypothetical protein BVRB_028870 [Beta vulgaris subsp. vulgaris]